MSGRRGRLPGLDDPVGPEADEADAHDHDENAAPGPAEDELAGEADLPALARALKGSPARAPAASLREIVDDVTRPRLFVPLGLEPTPGGGQALGAVPLLSTS